MAAIIASANTRSVGVVIFMFSRSPSHSVTLYPDASTTDASSVKSGEKANSVPVPTKDGYTFTGWQVKDGGAFSFDDAITADIELEAQFEKVTEPVEET